MTTPPARRPTSTAQRFVLELMAQGHRLYSPSDDEAWIPAPGGDRRLHRWTFPSLLRHGWIEADDARGWYWRITPAGRAALHHEPQATGDAQ